MPSLRSLSKYALSSLGASQSVFANMNSFNALSSCPSSPELSCHNTTAQPNLCCFNSPGGALLQTQFWDTNPPTGPDDSWTLHGLWPDNCDGTYEANCDPRRAYTNITEILQAAGADETLEIMQKFQTPGLLFLMGVLGSILVGVLFSLIIAAIMRRKPDHPFGSPPLQ